MRKLARFCSSCMRPMRRMRCKCVLSANALHHRIDRGGIADVDRMGAHDAATAAEELLRGALQHRPASPAEPQLGAQIEVFGGDLLAEAGAAAGDEDALTLEETFLEHGRSVASTTKRLF